MFIVIYKFTVYVDLDLLILCRKWWSAWASGETRQKGRARNNHWRTKRLQGRARCPRCTRAVWTRRCPWCWWVARVTWKERRERTCWGPRWFWTAGWCWQARKSWIQRIPRFWRAARSVLHLVHYALYIPFYMYLLQLPMYISDFVTVVSICNCKLEWNKVQENILKTKIPLFDLTDPLHNIIIILPWVPRSFKLKIHSYCNFIFVEPACG